MTDNKQLLEQIFAALATGDTRPYRDAMADELSWTVIGTTPWSGTFRGKQAVLTELMGPLFERFADRYTSTATRVIADRDHVVVEARGRVTTTSGAPYNNTYCLVFEVRDGKLRAVTEYCDTELVAAVLGPRTVTAPVDRSRASAEAS
jgi:uncharacterized protein